jgi:pimeloyl-ACP methyl ester carboxylesterase
VIEFLERLSVHHCTVIGYSMGGSIAIAVAALRPDLVSHLAVVESNLDPGGGTWSRRMTSSPEGEYCAHRHAELLKEIVQEGRTKPNWAALVGNLAVVAPHAVYRSSLGLVSGTSPSLRVNLIDVNGSRAYILGEDSLPNDQALGLRDQAITVPIIPRAGHHMIYENPKGFISVLAEVVR